MTNFCEIQGVAMEAKLDLKAMYGIDLTEQLMKINSINFKWKCFRLINKKKDKNEKT